MTSKNLSRIITVIVLIIVIIAIILLFSGRGENAKLELIGPSEMTVYQNTKFTDPGYDILNVSSDSGYYVNVDGNVNTNKVGIYIIKYELYNKNAQLLSSLERTIIVIKKSGSGIYIALNGEYEEYYFVDDYFDKGAIAYQNTVNISNSIIVDSNVIPNVVGDYEVKYMVNTINDEYEEVSRIVHIIDDDVIQNIDEDNLKIELIFNYPDYAYTLLPSGAKEYSKNITYIYDDIGNYSFDVYLNSGSHKIYNVNIVVIDRDGPVGTCTLYYDINKTQITMNVTDKSGISKYVYNGLEFNSSTTTLNSLITNVSIRAYDMRNNYSDIKCQAKYGTGFRNISVDGRGIIQNKSGYIVCNTPVSEVNKELNALMQTYGYKTRDAVAAAAVYLATYKYDIPYFWAGKTDSVGLDPYWGCRSDHTAGKPCGRPLASNNTVCEYGLDCAGFTRWAFIQAGFSTDILRKTGQESGMWGNFNAQAHNYLFNSNNTYYINQIKPGDIVYHPGHVGLVIGVDTDTIQVAEMTGPIIIDVIKKYTGVTTNSQSSFTGFVLFDDFFKMYGNS